MQTRVSELQLGHIDYRHHSEVLLSKHGDLTCVCIYKSQRMAGFYHPSAPAKQSPGPLVVDVDDPDDTATQQRVKVALGLPEA